MSDIDRTQVVIETKVDDSQAQKTLDKLEHKIDDLNTNIKVDFDVDKALDAIDRKIQELKLDIGRDITNGTKSPNYDRNKRSYDSLKEVRRLFVNGLKESDRETFGINDLNDMLTNIGFKLDGETISQINTPDDKGDNDVTGIKDAALEMHRLVTNFNSLAANYRNRDKDELSQTEVNKITAKMDKIKETLEKMGVRKEELPKGYGNMNYQKMWDAFIGRQQQKEEKEKQQQHEPGSKSEFGKIFGALVGIRSLFIFIRRIAAQNENLSAAINNLISSLASALAPILNFLATIINTLAQFLGGIFGFSKKTATSTGSMAKTLAGFDEINNIGGSSGGGAGGSTADPGINKNLWNILKGLLDMILAAIDIIWNAIKLVAAGLAVGLRLIVSTVATSIGLIVAAISGAVAGLTSGIITFITGIWNTIITVIRDVIKVILGAFTSFVDGFKKAREEGKSIFRAILEGLWNSIKTTAINLWNLFRNLISNVWNTIVTTLANFVTKFGEVFGIIVRWVNDNVVTPIGNSIKATWDNFIKPCLDNIANAWGTIKTGFKNFLNGVIGFINNIIYGINKLPGVNISSLSYMATGGFPEVGQLFVANEKGPEMIGRMGSQNAVINNEQIVKGVGEGVYNAIAPLFEGGSDRPIIINLDGKQIGSSTVSYIRNQSRILGRSVV